MFKALGKVGGKIMVYLKPKKNVENLHSYSTKKPTLPLLLNRLTNLKCKNIHKIHTTYY